MTTLLNGREVIMVDDNEAERSLAAECYLMSSLGNAWKEFPGGPQLLAYLEGVKRAEDRPPALLLLDINMPEMTGFEVLEWLAAEPYFRNVPVLFMLTNSENPDDAETATRLGALECLRKPDNVREYVALFDGLPDRFGP